MGHQDPGPTASRSGPSAFGTTQTTSGRSSTGRAPVSKTGGWGFESLRPCESWKVPRAPDPRPGREASEQRGTGLTVMRPWGHLSRLRPQRWGVRANSIVDSIRQEPDPHCGSGFLSPQRPTAETSGMPALRHMRRLGNWLARLAVDQVPCGHAGSSPARRTLHGEGPADGRRRQPFRKRKAHTGVRVRSSLPPRMEDFHLPPGSVGPVGVDARLSSGRSRVRAPYGAHRS